MTTPNGALSLGEREGLVLGDIARCIEYSLIACHGMRGITHVGPHHLRSLFDRQHRYLFLYHNYSIMSMTCLTKDMKLPRGNSEHLLTPVKEINNSPSLATTP